MAAAGRAGRVDDVRDLALGMPFSTELAGSQGRPIFQVGGRSFIFFRNPRPDALDDHGGKVPDVIMFWVPSEADKFALLAQDDSPLFSTPRFDGHPSVLLREADIGRLTLAQLTELVQDAWLARASRKRAADWLATHGLS